MKSILPKLVKIVGWIVGVAAVVLLLDYTIFRGLELGAVTVPRPRRSRSPGSIRAGAITIPVGRYAITTI